MHRKLLNAKMMVVLAVLLVALISVSAMASHPDGGEFVVGTGGTLITITIMPTVRDYGTDFKVYTDENNLLDALLGVNLIEGEAVSWGFNITTVDGREVDYRNGGYWHIYRGNTLESETEAIPIEAGDSFFFTLSANWTEDDEGNTILLANNLDLPWPEKWPADVPKINGRIIAYFGGDDPETSGGLGVGLEVKEWDGIEAYVRELALLGYEIEEKESDAFSYLATLTGNDYQITVTKEVDCMIYVKKQ